MALMRAFEMTWVELRGAAPGAVALLPVGSTEAHGPHLPLGTDVIIAEAVCARVAQRLALRGIASVLFPALSHGLTEFAASFAGTVSIPEAAVVETLAAACEGIARAGFAKVAVVNHHLEPAHFAAVKAGVEKARATLASAQSQVGLACPDHRKRPWAPLLGEEFCRGGSHAGFYETSLVLAAAPGLVRDEIRAALPPLDIDLAGRIRAGATDFASCGGPEAYFGHPELASANEGHRLLDILADLTVAALDDC